MVKLLVKLLKHSIVHFTNMIKSLEIFTLKVIVKFRKRPSIKTINDSFANRSFSFSIIEQKNVSSKINELYSLKALQDTMFHKNLEKNVDFLGPYLLILWLSNYFIKFPFSLNCANITMFFKKSYRNLQENCRTVSILP